MQVKILQEAGYEWACMGMAYSYKDRKEPRQEWWEKHRDRAFSRAVKLHDKDGGHNKFLESIQVWIDIEATRSFWQEFDTYRVGMSKQSESTMHTLNKRRPEYDDFESYVTVEMIEAYQAVWDIYKGMKDEIMYLKENLPEGFLQRRVVNTNYKTLRNLVMQRSNHRYIWWRELVAELKTQLEHPELVIPESMRLQ